MPAALDYTLVKKPFQRLSFTQMQIEHFVKCSDPNYFMRNFYYIQHPTKGKVLYQPFKYQEDFINICNNYVHSIALLPRQSGKTTCVAGYLLWYAMFIPDSTVLIAAHKYQGAQEIMQRIRMGYEFCPDFIRAGVTTYNKGSIEFENGSRIVSQTTTENTGRGMSISCLFLDEFAFVRNSVAKEFWASIVPTLSTGGKSIITSTPNSDEDQFWEIWRDANKTQDEFGEDRDIGRNGYKAFKAEWWEHPDRGEKWAEDQKSKLGEEKFSREILCNPMIYDETLISPSKLLDLRHQEPLFKQGQVKWFKKPSKDHSYVVSLDPSLGTGGDFAAIQVFELPEMEQVAEWQHNKTRIQGQIKVIKEILEFIFSVVGEENDIYYSIENNTVGEAGLVAISEIGEENLRGVFLSEPKRIGNVRSFRKGFNTTQRSKIAACSKLKNWVERDKMIIHSKNFISELKTFVSNGGSFAAKSGETDDLVMSAILAVRMVDFLQGYDPELDEKLKAADEFIEPMPFIFVSS